MKLTLGEIIEDGYTRTGFLKHNTVKGITDLLEGEDIEAISLNDKGLEVLSWIEAKLVIDKDFRIPKEIHIRCTDREKRTAMIESLKRIEKVTGKHLWLGDTDN